MSNALFTLPAALCAFLGWRYLHLIANPHLASHLLFLPVHHQDDLLSVDEARALRDVAMQQLKTFRTVNKNPHVPTYEHIGEAVPSRNGSCEHAPHKIFGLKRGKKKKKKKKKSESFYSFFFSFKVPSHDGTQCILPSNADVTLKWLHTGGIEGLKEPANSLMSRATSFTAYDNGAEALMNVPAVRKVFSSEQFRAFARRSCPRDRQLLDDIGVQFVIHVPGQSSPVQLSPPFFFGATPERFPHWVLSAMSHSGIYRDKYIAQVQVHTFIHEWDATLDRGGTFAFWRDDARSPHYVLPHSRTAIASDGARIVHTVTTYHGPNETFAPPPPIPPLGDCELTFVGNDKWRLSCNGTPVTEYATSDLRLSVVYRGHCFRDEQSKEKFRTFPESAMFTLAELEAIFRRDLEMRWRIYLHESVPPLDFAMRIIKEYVRFPHSPVSRQPYNYCSWPMYYPILAGPLGLLC
jgi:hypothetical protein